MTDVLHHGYCIRFLFGMLTKTNQIIEQFINIGHIKIPANNEVAGHPVILSSK